MYKEEPYKIRQISALSRWRADKHHLLYQRRNSTQSIRRYVRGQLIPHNPAEDATRRRYIDIANQIIIGDITFDEAVLKMKDDYHAEYRLRKLISGDFLNPSYDDLDYDYIRHKWAIRKDFYKKGWFKIMHPVYKRMFPNVKPKKLGRGGTVTYINMVLRGLTIFKIKGKLWRGF